MSEWNSETDNENNDSMIELKNGETTEECTREDIPASIKSFARDQGLLKFYVDIDYTDGTTTNKADATDITGKENNITCIKIFSYNEPKAL